MRTLIIASATVALMTSGASAEQSVVSQGPGVTPGMVQANNGWQGNGWQGNNTPTVRVGGSRWGSNVGGHWWGGVNAPGGWNAYRRPVRGYVLPSYWISPRFYVNNWSGYGLRQPTAGYRWVRYYDDAVLIDNRGSVYDVADGIDWDQYDQGYYTDDTTVYSGPTDRGYDAGGNYAQGVYAQGAYPQGRGTPVPPGYAGQPVHREQNGSNGLAGAAVGAAVGGVAGNLIAGKGNRLGGTLIGAGVGGLAGYAVDKSSSTKPRYARPPVAPDYPPPPPPPQGYASQPGYTTAQANLAQQGYASSSPYGAQYGANDEYRERRGSDGLAGAAVGAAAGGVAGNVIAGKGNRLGGTLIGAGVGAAAGYAIDKSSNARHDRYPAPDYRGQGYPPPVYPQQAYPQQGYAQRGNYRHGYAAGGPAVTTVNGATVVTTSQGGGYAAGGYYYPAGSTTTVVVQSAPVVTTTTTEIYEDTVTYVKPRTKRVYRGKTLRRNRGAATCACN
ncbi:MAG: RcnB family protein [Sphingomonas bacterium]|nr:RcnB family protein [Sphingomonas bacterium]